MISGHRAHAPYWAFLLHRISGLGLVLFLPVHFYVLGTALEPARLDSILAWTDQPLVKVAEIGLVVLLALHMMGGLRLLALEFLPWSDAQKTRIAVASGVALGLGLLFGLGVMA